MKAAVPFGAELLFSKIVLTRFFAYFLSWGAQHWRPR